MPHPFIRKLRYEGELTAEDEQRLSRLLQPTHRIEARRDIVSEGEPSPSLAILMEGWACRYKVLANGRRQLMSIFLPGDLTEPFGILPRFVEDSLGAITPVTIARIDPQSLRQIASGNSRIEEALWWDLLVAWAIEREKIVSIGQRSASERLGHLFCELHLRLEMVGLVGEGTIGYDMPLTQSDLGDLVGLSTVHVNRSLQELRNNGLISLRERRLSIHNLAGLRDFSMFDPAYLHRDGSPARPRGARDR